MMKCIIAGGRDVPPQRAQELVRKAISESGWAEQISEVVYGGARGIDSAAYEVANGVWPTKLFRADWDAHGKAAGPIRNRQMAEYANALIAIWDGKSRGTKNMIAEAQKCCLRVFVLYVNMNWEAPQ